jgi:hypothetical protein
MLSVDGIICLNLESAHDRPRVANTAAAMGPVTEATMAAFDYRIVAELFPAGSPAESLPPGRRRFRRQPVGYGRFARAADAIRFAIEELPPELLRNVGLEVNAEIFDGGGIRRLYDSNEYPLVRRATTVARTRSTRGLHQSSRRDTDEIPSIA